ncbi:MAG: isoprenyl transferase [Saprospiraceae bacterium]|nr:MAG: isoprenyl transferase [Saprospiraceae bacterium]
MDLKQQIIEEKLPKHIAIIMDGNGRWAKQRGLPRVEGHRNGVQAVREASEAAAELGVAFLTLYAFSTENWARPETEVDALMGLLVETIQREIKTLNDNNIRLRAIGDIASMPAHTAQALQWAMEQTAHNTGMNLVLALNYSGRWEIVDATRKIAQKISDGLLRPDQIDAEVFSSALQTAEMPDPELLIRTSGEKRISNFLLWQLAYAELCFLPIMWPDFRKEHLYQAIIDFQHRERRFGKTSEQVK